MLRFHKQAKRKQRGFYLTVFGKGVSLRAMPGVEIIRLKENKEELGEIECINSEGCVCVFPEKSHRERGTELEEIWRLSIISVLASRSTHLSKTHECN